MSSYPHGITDVQSVETQYASELMKAVQQGRSLWTSPTLGSNGVACAQCHPNAANTPPETYPKFQKQIGKVIPVWEMLRWCLHDPLEGIPLAANDPKMTALQALSPTNGAASNWSLASIKAMTGKRFY